jgi:hypothetical protein
VVPARDLAAFSLGRLPDDARGRHRAEDLAARLHAHLGGRKATYGEAARALGVHPPNMLRYAGATGTVLIRWDGAHQPTIWTVPAPKVEPGAARLELVRRYLHVFGPSMAPAFGRWAGIGPNGAQRAFDALDSSLTAVRTPIGDGLILSEDEATFRERPGPAAAARLLPSGDPYYLAQGAERELLLPEAHRRAALWTPRVWPGAVLLGGKIEGTWSRSNLDLTVHPWRRFAAPERAAVEAEAASLPLPGDRSRIRVTWMD